MHKKRHFFLLDLCIPRLTSDFPSENDTQYICPAAVLAILGIFHACFQMSTALHIIFPLPGAPPPFHCRHHQQKYNVDYTLQSEFPFWYDNFSLCLVIWVNWCSHGVTRSFRKAGLWFIHHCIYSGAWNNACHTVIAEGIMLTKWTRSRANWLSERCMAFFSIDSWFYFPIWADVILWERRCRESHFPYWWPGGPWLKPGIRNVSSTFSCRQWWQNGRGNEAMSFYKYEIYQLHKS